MLSAQLPAALRAALESQASGFSTRDLARAAARLSEGYRGEGLPRLDSRLDCVAYAVTRMPATFGAVRAALRELDGNVESVLDLGAGTGASAWAVNDVFGAGTGITMVERNASMAELGRGLGAPGAWRVSDLRNLAGLGRHDLAVFSYSLGELGEREAEEAVARAWEQSERALLVVEPGTPAGFSRVLLARRKLLELGARIAAPCPQDGECPIKRPDWCHFAVRVERSRLHKQLKGGDLGYEDEKFSYVLATRGLDERRRTPARVLRHPAIVKGLIQLELCTPAGLERAAVGRRSKDAFRRARKTSWGNRWETADE